MQCDFSARQTAQQSSQLTREPFSTKINIFKGADAQAAPWRPTRRWVRDGPVAAAVRRWGGIRAARPHRTSPHRALSAPTPVRPGSVPRDAAVNPGRGGAALEPPLRERRRELGRGGPSRVPPGRSLRLCGAPRAVRVPAESPRAPRPGAAPWARPGASRSRAARGPALRHGLGRPTKRGGPQPGPQPVPLPPIRALPAEPLGGAARLDCRRN